MLIQTSYYQTQMMEPFLPLSQSIKMIRFFIPKTDENYMNLTENEKEAFKLFSFQILCIILTHVFERSFTQQGKELEAITLYSLNVFKGVILSHNLQSIHYQIKLTSFLKLLIQLIYERKGKIKEKIVTIVMSFIEMK